MRFVTDGSVAHLLVLNVIKKNTLFFNNDFSY